MPLRTKGFDVALRSVHFQKHGHEHNWIDSFQYEKDADHFLTKPINPTMHECRRQRDGACIRFDESTNEFGILRANGFISTYFYRHHRGLQYFAQECSR